MKFVRRGREKRKEREAAVKNSISSELKESIGYKILLNMGWERDTGLGKDKNGRTSISEMVQRGGKHAADKAEKHEKLEEEYNSILKKQAEKANLVQ